MGITLIILTLAAFTGSALFMAASYSYEELVRQEEEIMNNIVENYSSWLNVFRGLMVVTLLPVGVIYLILSFFNQSIRTYCPCSFFSGTNMHIGLLTKRTSKQLDVVKSWNQVKVMSYAILWGFGYMMFQVIAVQFLALVLGW